MTVHDLGWGADQTAIRAACNLAGHEPKDTRWRLKPIAFPTAETLRAEHEAYRTKGRRRKTSAVVILADIRAARQRERDDPDGISTWRPRSAGSTREAQEADEPSQVRVSSSTKSATKPTGHEPISECETVRAFNKWR